jgi:translation initiation factor 2 beta subunit (eIF-2beta)/eIF-5
MADTKVKDEDVVEELDDEVEEETTYTPADLAKATGRDPKQVRDYLRKEHTRPIEEKNSDWVITQEIFDSVVEHFEAIDAKKSPATDEADDSDEDDES